MVSKVVSRLKDIRLRRYEDLETEETEEESEPTVSWHYM